jgi:integrase
MKKEGKVIPDITEDLDSRGEKPKFVYFTQPDFENVLIHASSDLKPIVALAYDSGARVTEMLNIKVSDLSNDFTELTIRDEVSKTFGRRIKLMLCTNQIREFVNKYGLSNNEYVCQKSLVEINHELRKIARKVFSPEQIKYKNLTLKDFRHSSACFWLPRYKSESAMKYRFGWKKSDMIHYYTEFLGMKDTITQDDMYVDITKSELEKEVDRLRSDMDVLKDSVRELIALARERSII